MAVTIKKKPKINISFKSTKKADASIPTGDTEQLVKTAIGEAIVQVSSNGVKQPAKISNDQVAAVVAKGPLANVGLQMSRTIDLGNYNSVKIQVSLHIPSEVTQGDMDEAFDFASAWCNDKMEILTGEYTNGNNA